MTNVTFITGNQGKADFLAKFLGFPVDHQKVDLEEIQSLDLKKIAEHKARGAYDIVKDPVLVEDMGLSFSALGRLPGAFTKWFYEEIGLEKMCRLLDGYEDKSGFMQIFFAYFDGANIKFFEGKLNGTIAEHPLGGGGFGFDPIFIPSGQDKTLAEMNDEETQKYSLRTTQIFPQLKEFLATLDPAN
jgi:non-canonical purine NTP pyrophosphatase (RdgB/HAM1 family)